jgi:hypothetical protein
LDKNSFESKCARASFYDRVCYIMQQAWKTK